MRKWHLCVLGAVAVTCIIIGALFLAPSKPSGSAIAVSAYQRSKIDAQTGPALDALRANGYVPMRIVFGPDKRMKAVEFRPACAASDFICTQQSAPAPGVAWVRLSTLPVYPGSNVPISDASPQIVFDAQLYAGVTVCTSLGWHLDPSTFPAIIKHLYSALREGGQSVIAMGANWTCNRTN